MSEVLRVVQLNAGSLLEPNWAERRYEIVAWLDRLAPDIVCLQEVWDDADTDDAATWIANEMRDVGWHHHFDGRPFGAELWPDHRLRFGSAVMSRWPIDAATYHALPVADDDDDPFVHNVPWELLHVRTADLDVYSCHLAAAPTHARHRRRQVVFIDKVISSTAPGATPATPGERREAMPPILCGDFNAEPESDEIRFLSGFTVLDGRSTYFQDAWHVAGEGHGYTQDWRSNPIADAMNVPRKRIDYVFVGDPFMRRDDAGRVLNAELACDRSLTGPIASDHFGLVVEMRWPQRP